MLGEIHVAGSELLRLLERYIFDVCKSESSWSQDKERKRSNSLKIVYRIRVQIQARNWNSPIKCKNFVARPEFRS